MIRGPKGAIPTHRGWVHSVTGELLKSQRITDAQIAEWHGEPKPVLQTLHEAPVVEILVDEDLADFHYNPVEDPEDDGEEE